ncbi:hypothetical protein PG999_002999 [Apiospora kogelbergensis]|uniref:Uncharacterized protein n=1 Tax=Apiospora kogelbergensis TaxID=1337665 RepID=A0AAW0R9R7_9PEZI
MTSPESRTLSSCSSQTTIPANSDPAVLDSQLSFPSTTQAAAIQEEYPLASKSMPLLDAVRKTPAVIHELLHRLISTLIPILEDMLRTTTIRPREHVASWPTAGVDAAAVSGSSRTIAIAANMVKMNSNGNNLDRPNTAIPNKASMSHKPALGRRPWASASVNLGRSADAVIEHPCPQHRDVFLNSQPSGLGGVENLLVVQDVDFEPFAGRAEIAQQGNDDLCAPVLQARSSHAGGMATPRHQEVDGQQVPAGVDQGVAAHGAFVVVFVVGLDPGLEAFRVCPVGAGTRQGDEVGLGVLRWFRADVATLEFLLWRCLWAFECCSGGWGC